jgi:hypothetical protein
MSQNISELIDEFNAAWNAMWTAHAERYTKGLQPRFFAVHHFQQLCGEVSKAAGTQGIDPAPIEYVAIHTTDIKMEHREAVAGVIQCLRTNPPGKKPEWSRPMSKAAIARELSITVRKLDELCEIDHYAIEKLSRKTWKIRIDGLALEQRNALL